MQGLELSRRFYFEAVRPILGRRFPEFRHAAALIGYGSDVLGLDDDTSRDHEWGPRVQLFTPDPQRKQEIESVLAAELPARIGDFPTNFGPTDEQGTARMAPVGDGPLVHRAEVLDLGAYLRERVGCDPGERLDARRWLVMPTQRLLELTAGEVFTDPIGDLTQVRELLRWYPHDVWLYSMAGHWQQIAEYEHFLGRTGSRGDELGSRLVAASLVRDLMRLGFLQERRYAPYAKWFGTAYRELRRPEQPAVEAALAARDWRSREDALVDAYEAVARRHNDLGVTESVDPTVRPFWGRPFRVLFADRFAQALVGAIEDPSLRALDHRAGPIDALSDNTTLRERPPLWEPMLGLYDRR